MKLIAFHCFFSLALAYPSIFSKRQDQPAAGQQASTSVYNEFTAPGATCKSAILIYSRGTGEPRNVGILGRGLVRELKKAIPDVAIEGVEYSAAVQGNMTPQGADAGGIRNATELFKHAASKCPKAALIGGGYSQGAALQHRAIEALPKNVQDRIAAVVLYGDTKNKQDGGRIKNFPPEKVKIFCNQNDGVCGGALNVNAGHLSYSDKFVPGAEFIKGKVDAMLAAQGGS